MNMTVLISSLKTYWVLLSPEESFYFPFLFRVDYQHIGTSRESLKEVGGERQTAWRAEFPLVTNVTRVWYG